MRQRALVWTGILVLLLAACGPGQQATATPTSRAPAGAPTSTPAPGATPIQPTRPAASPTPAPSATPAGTGPKYGGTLKTPMRTDPVGWDAMQISGGYLDMRKQFNVVFGGLITRPSVPEVNPCQSSPRLESLEGFRWVDDRTLELKLRPGIRFHNKPPVNGREATAEDLAYSLNRAAFVWPVSGAKNVAAHIKSIDAIDRYTVRVKTDGPVPQIGNTLLATYFGSAIVPSEAVTKEPLTDPSKAYIGTGPFMFKEYRRGVKVVHVRNPDYWKKDLPYLDGLEFAIMPDVSTRLAALLSGKLDLWVEEVPAPVVDSIKKYPAINVQGCPSTSGYNFLWMDLFTPNSPFKDVRVRRAVSMAIDRDAILKTIMQGQGMDAPFAPPPLNEWYLTRDAFPQPIRKYLEYRPEEAKKLLAEAGYPPGALKTQIEVTARYTSPYPELVEGIADQLNSVGIDARLDWREYVSWLEREQDCQWQGMRISRLPYEDQWRLMGRLHSKAGCPENKGGVSDPELDKLIERLVVTVDLNKQKELAAQIQARFVDQAWAVSVPDFLDYSAANPWVKNWNRGGYAAYSSTYTEVVWLDK